ncbi:helix-turn-helix domain-containing protein [Nonomuraea sp. K274]|uniref:Helix-turn-helix domain-containing protein n=1 Tax=Nonomuraea cypriaca TaxID=1187855 RepID=A0A931AG01_9ACTN|nr:helix-turn-helix transcriptional regulator [Nonomuraea cypriaca]MBF8189828.1 helix-turn-helix domain-containing protein [Nonomuraea cypriaca]
MDSSQLLGQMLRARREAITLAAVGVRDGGLLRQASGLEQEQVAMLAGVSTAYYVRLEQGREHRPPTRVLDTLARILELGPGEAARLRELGSAWQGSWAERSRRVDPALRRLIQSWPATPAFVFDRRMDVLARNRLATALHDGLEDADGLFRPALLGAEGRGFVQENAGSGGFRPAGRMAAQVWRVRHCEVGELTLICDVFEVDRTPGQRLLVYQAERDSPSEQALALLGSLAATKA